MDDSTLTSFFDKGLSNEKNSKFTVTYKEPDGKVLHGQVRLVALNHYEVYVEEKQVIIHCIKDASGALSCSLNTHGNPQWVDGISKEVERKLRKRLE